MKKFVLKLILFSGLIIGSCMALFILPVEDTENYLLANIDKNRFLISVKSPKMVLVGGSSLAFGVDSYFISNEINLPVVNMGLHGGLGLVFMINEVKPYLKKGDIVLLVPEYELFVRPNGSSTLIELLDLHRNNIIYLNLNQITTLIEFYPEYARSKIKKIISSSSLPNTRVKGVYFRHAFIDNGDMISHLDSSKSGYAKDISLLPPPDISLESAVPGVKVVIEFNEWCKSEGITLLISYPAFPETHFQHIDEFSSMVDMLLLQNGLSVISKPEKYEMPASSFFDTLYHLNEIGRMERTKKLTEDIMRFFGY